MEIFALTHPGYKRKNNEDHSLIKEFSDSTCLLAVADGMGGQTGGKVASRIAIRSLENYDQSLQDAESQLVGLIEAGHSEIFKAVKKNPALSGMGTTLSVAYIRGNLVRWAHVGDSRIYLFRDGDLLPITNDHTVPGMLMKKNRITEEEARKHPMKNLLLRCVGCKKCEPEAGHFKVKPGDTVFICSDGLYGGISPDAIVSIMKTEQSWEHKFEDMMDSILETGEVPPNVMISMIQSNQSLEKKLRALLDAALEAGGSDNITIVGAEI